MKAQTTATSIAVIAAGILFFAQNPSAQGAGIHVICSNGLKGAIEKILPEYERASGHHVTIEYGASAVLKRTIEDGKAFDLAILTPAVIDDLIKEAKIAAGTHADIAKSDLGVGIRTGAPVSDISTADALKRRLLAAKSITYAKEGAATAAFVAMLDRLGIAEAVRSKTVLQTVSGRPSESVAEGQNELAFAPLSEIVPVKGVQVLGLLPKEFQSPLVMTGGIGSHAAQAEAARSLLQFLTGPKSMSAIEASGMAAIATK